MSIKSIASVVLLCTAALALGPNAEGAEPKEGDHWAATVSTAEELISVMEQAPYGTGLDSVADLLVGRATGATTLRLSVTSGGRKWIRVAPGSPVRYQVVGLLTRHENEGLALFGLTLVLDGGDLIQADEPTGEPTPGCDNPMINFAIPWGITNPDGFGGTVIGGDLVQVGGAQNTINNTPDNAPYPIGSVLTGVAKPSGCGRVVLVTGTLIAPNELGTYALSITDAFANVIRAGETGEPFWATESVDVESGAPLKIRTVPVKGSSIRPDRGRR